MRLASPLLLTLLAAAPLAAQSNLERMINDRYTRSHDYDLVHQRIELSDISWDSLSFTGRVTTTLVSLRPGLDSVILDAGHLLDITRLRVQGKCGSWVGQDENAVACNLIEVLDFVFSCLGPGDVLTQPQTRVCLLSTDIRAVC